MSLIFALIMLCGDTVTLTNGEIFVGKVVAQNEQRVWLKLGKGGMVAFEREQIEAVEVSGAKASAPASGADKPQPVRTPAVPPPAATKTPAAAKTPVPVRAAPVIAAAPPAAPPSSAEPGGETTRYSLKCPTGFQKDVAAEKAPVICVLHEPASGARITLTALPFPDKGLAEAVDCVRAEIGETLLAEREFQLKDAALDARLFERELVNETETRGELSLVFVQDGVEYKLAGSVRKNLLEQYRDVFLESFASFTLARVQGAAAAPSSPGREDRTSSAGARAGPERASRVPPVPAPNAPAPGR